MSQDLFTVSFPEDRRTAAVAPHTTLLEAAIQAGLQPDAPCGGRGTCGKCRVRILSGRENLLLRGGPVPATYGFRPASSPWRAMWPPPGPRPAKTAFSPAART